MNEDNSKLNLLIAIFLLIVIGAVLTVTLADENQKVRADILTVTNETIIPSNTATINLDNKNLISITEVNNGTTPGFNVTEVLTVANYTKSTTAYYLRNGLFILEPGTEYDGETLNISYTFYQIGYVRDSTSRVILNLIPLFFVIALLLFVAMPILKKLEVFGN